MVSLRDLRDLHESVKEIADSLDKIIIQNNRIISKLECIRTGT